MAGKFDGGIASRGKASPAAGLIAELQDTKKDADHTATPSIAKRSGRALDSVSKVRKDGKENHTRRVELLLKPSAYEALKAEAEADGRSLNSYIGKILAQHLERDAK